MQRRESRIGHWFPRGGRAPASLSSRTPVSPQAQCRTSKQRLSDRMLSRPGRQASTVTFHYDPRPQQPAACACAVQCNAVQCGAARALLQSKALRVIPLARLQRVVELMRLGNDLDAHSSCARQPVQAAPRHAAAESMQQRACPTERICRARGSRAGVAAPCTFTG